MGGLFLLVCFLAAPVASAQAPEFQVLPQVKQGFVLRIDVRGSPSGEGWETQFLGKKYPIYSSDGATYGLVPVPALQSPGPAKLSVVSGTGATLFATTIEVLDAGYPQQNITTSSRMRTLKASDDEVKRMQEFRKLESSRRLWTEPFLRPTPECINSPFGVQRLHDGKPTGNIHAGLDLRSPAGRQVRAAADGIVRIARKFPRQGGTVGLDHGHGVLSTYIHLSKVIAAEGATVKRGALIGLVGSTGFATGPHLHWTVSVHSVPVNPAQWSPGKGACP